MQQLLATDSAALLEKIQALIEREKKDWWDELTPEQQEALDESIRQADRGEVIPHDEVIANPEKWL